MTEDAPVTGREQREVWQEERERLGLVPGTPGFGRQGVMARVDGPAVQVVLLPADPSVGAVEFDAGLAGAVPGELTGVITNGVRVLGQVSTSSTHLFKEAAGDGGAGSRALLGVARHGGVVVGIAERSGRYPLGDGGGQAQRLSAVSGAVRLAIKAQAAVLAHLSERGRWAPGGPWELAVALPGARGTVLGALADGWDEPGRGSDGHACAGDDPLVVLELDGIPGEVRAQREVLRRVLARLVNAFGTTLPLYLPAGGSEGEVPDAY